MCVIIIAKMKEKKEKVRCLFQFDYNSKQKKLTDEESGNDLVGSSPC